MDTLKPKVKGYITITNPVTNEILFEGSNTIDANALQILMRSLSNLNSAPSVDIIRAIGSGIDVDKVISSATFNLGENSLNFQALFLEADFDGTVTETRLKSSILGLDFAVKTGLSILKGAASQLSIAWKITLT